MAEDGNEDAETECFVLSQKASGSEYADVEGQRYAWTSTSSGARMRLAEAEGAPFVYYRPGKASDGTAQCFFGHGRIGSVEAHETSDGTSYVAELGDYEAFAQPVPFKQGPTKSAQTSIQTITADEYHQLVELGSASASDPKVLVAYFGATGAENFEFAKQEGRWGFPSWHDALAEVDEGDWILLGGGYTGGSVRTSSAAWAEESVSSVAVGRLSGPAVEEDAPLWPDEVRDGQVKYPARVSFVLAHDFGAQPTDHDGPLGAASEALRLSAVGHQGKLVSAADVPLLAQIDEDGGSTSMTTEPPEAADLAPLADHFTQAVDGSGLRFEGDVPRALLAAMATKPFGILTGLSGSGKTQIAKRLGEWFGEANYDLIPVRPDWTGPEMLFGFEDALQEAVAGHGRPWYVPRALEFMLHAAANPSEPHLMVLDEMNLAHVERYFADFLSGMESHEDVLPNLHAVEQHRAVPVGLVARVPLPSNLFVIGTVNVDETTYTFSPKVLDRANSFEFRVDTETLDPAAQAPKPISKASAADLSALLGVAVDSGWHNLNEAAGAEFVAEALQRLHRMLLEDGYEFGHRVFFEALRFTSIYCAMGASKEEALDRVVMQKILPRIHGSRRQVDRPLARVTAFALDPSADEAAETCAGLETDGGEAVLPIALEKCRRMISRMEISQFTSFTD